MWINWEKEIFEIKMNLWRRKLSRPINKCPFLIGVPDQTNRKWEVTSYALVTKKLLWERIPQEPIIVALEFPVYWVNPSIKDWIRNNPSMNRMFEIRSVWSTKNDNWLFYSQLFFCSSGNSWYNCPNPVTVDFWIIAILDHPKCPGDRIRRSIGILQCAGRGGTGCSPSLHLSPKKDEARAGPALSVFTTE